MNHVRVGDKVLLSYNFCRECTVCKSNALAYCDKMVQLNFGGRRLDGSQTMSLQEGNGIFSNIFGQSPFSRHAIVSELPLAPVLQDTPMELFAPLRCGLQTGAGAVLNVLNVQPGRSIAISGVGSVALVPSWLQSFSGLGLSLW